MNYTKEQKVKIYETLPPDLKEAIISVERVDKIESIAKKYSLMLDQESEMADEINLLMIGLTKQKDFVKNISSRLNIDNSKAQSIATDINTDIFYPIRTSLQKIQERSDQATESSTISSLEQVGGFTIEKPAPASSSPLYKENNISRESVLKGIEDKPAVAAMPDHIPMIDHLLTTPVHNEEKIEIKIPVETKVVEKPVEKKTYGADPYREAV